MPRGEKQEVRVLTAGFKLRDKTYSTRTGCRAPGASRLVAWVRQLRPPLSPAHTGRVGERNPTKGGDAMTTRRQVWGVLLAGAVAAAAWGCASSMDSRATAGPVDLSTLAGTWQGTASGTAGLSQPITMRIGADGTYTTAGGVFTSQGTAQVKDGKLVMTSTATTGGQLASPVATAVLSERREPSQVIQVLSGSGASSAGPYSFEVSRPKQ
jgi:hypothetical protein